jgi:hypothetical protein
MAGYDGTLGCARSAVHEYTRRRCTPPKTRTVTLERWQPLLLFSTSTAVALTAAAVEARTGGQGANVSAQYPGALWTAGALRAESHWSTGLALFCALRASPFAIKCGAN